MQTINRCYVVIIFIKIDISYQGTPGASYKYLYWSFSRNLHQLPGKCLLYLNASGTHTHTNHITAHRPSPQVKSCGMAHAHAANCIVRRTHFAERPEVCTSPVKRGRRRASRAPWVPSSPTEGRLRNGPFVVLKIDATSVRQLWNLGILHATMYSKIDKIISLLLP